jgi:hypothetical protein
LTIDEYKKWKYGGHICELPNDVLNTLISVFTSVKNTIPDSGDEHTYKQWYLQDRQQVDNTFIREVSFTLWRNSYDHQLNNVLEFFNGYVKTICRFRMSSLPTGLNVNYHSSHQLPRVHIPLNDCNSVFVVKDSDEIEHEFNLQFGHAYFLNVTYPHKVIGDNKKIRENCFFCFTDFRSNFKEHYLK